MRWFSSGLVRKRSRGAVARLRRTLVAAGPAGRRGRAGGGDGHADPRRHDAGADAVQAAWPRAPAERSRRASSARQTLSCRRTALRSARTPRAVCAASRATARRTSCCPPAMRRGAISPTRPGTYPSVDDGGGRRSAAAAALDVNVRRSADNSARLGRRSASGAASRLRLPLPLRGVPVPARQRRSTTPSSPSSTRAVDDAARRASTRTGRTSPSPPDGKPVTINSTGAGVDVARRGGRHAVRRGDRPLHAQVPVPPADEPSRCCFSLFDHGDAPCDSAVFIDNLTLHANATCLPDGRHLARPGRGDHRAHGRRHGQHANADAHRHGRQRGGRCADVAVRIYNGAVPAGAPVQTLSAPRIGNTWSAQRGALAPGQYTAQATQANARPTASARPPPSRSSGAGAARPGRRRRLEQPAEPRRPRQRRHPGRPGHLRRLAAAGPRQDLRRARGLRQRLHQVPAGHRAAGGGDAAEGVRGAEGRGQRPDGRAARHAQGPRGRDVGPRHERERGADGGLLRRDLRRSSSRRPRRSRRSRRC